MEHENYEAKGMAVPLQPVRKFGKNGSVARGYVVRSNQRIPSRHVEFRRFDWS